MGKIINKEIENYIRKLAPERSEFMLEMEKYAAENHVSIIPPEAAQFLTFLMKLHGAKKVLEIGTAIGYSTIWLAWAATPEGHVTTLEINEPRFQAASKNIQIAGLEDRITIIKGHAADTLPTLQGTFDFIFIDAGKGQYEWFLEQLYPILNPGGLIVFDNVLSQGLVVLPDEEIQRRQRTSVRRLRDFVKKISSFKGMETTIIPIGDGMTVSLKKLEVLE